MACTTEKFVINKGVDNEFILKIKARGTTLPLVIEDSDKFTIRMYLLETNALVATFTQTDSPEGLITFHDKTNGQILLKIKDTFTTSLQSDRGSKADRYYLKPTHRAVIEAETTNSGTFSASVDLIYVR